MISTELYNQLHALDEADLNQVRQIAWTLLEDMRATRSRALKRELAPDMAVRIVGNISPKYLKGLTGKVASYPEGKYVAIKWDIPRLARRYAYSDSIRVPLDCVEVIS